MTDVIRAPTKHHQLRHNDQQISKDTQNNDEQLINLPDDLCYRLVLFHCVFLGFESLVLG
jgi:hypothetical protein